jgi:hypothetical protein
MARARTQPAPTTKGNNIMPLSDDQIRTLLSKTRQKGVYTERLNEFIESGQAGVSVNEQWADLSGKNDTTLKQWLEAAKEKKEALEGADKVIVKSDDEKVYLINLAHVEGLAEAAV